MCALLASAIVSVTENQRDANRLRDFRSATRQSYLAADVAEALAAERVATAVHRVAPDVGRTGRTGLGAAQGRCGAAPRGAAGQPARATARRRGQARRRAADSCRHCVCRRPPDRSARRRSPMDTARSPTALSRSSAALTRVGRRRASGRAADAYLALLQAIEAAERERVDLASALAAPRPATPPFPLRWVALEAAQLDAFRQNASSRLTAELDAILFQPASVRVRQRARAARRGSTGHGRPHVAWSMARRFG